MRTEGGCKVLTLQDNSHDPIVPKTVFYQVQGGKEASERSGKRSQQAPVRKPAGAERQAHLRQMRQDAEAVCERAGGPYRLAVQAEGAGEEDGFPRGCAGPLRLPHREGG